MQRTPEPAQDTPMSVSAGLAPPEGAEKTKKRPRLDMAVEPCERKRGNVRARPMHADEGEEGGQGAERERCGASSQPLVYLVFLGVLTISALFYCLFVWNDVLWASPLYLHPLLH